jgi:hypothetical protein
MYGALTDHKIRLTSLGFENTEALQVSKNRTNIWVLAGELLCARFVPNKSCHLCTRISSLQEVKHCPANMACGSDPMWMKLVVMVMVIYYVHVGAHVQQKHKLTRISSTYLNFGPLRRQMNMEDAMGGTYNRLMHSFTELWDVSS